jgi:hypothetical protein
MILRTLIVTWLLFAVTSTAAWSQEGDAFMGNYEGAFTSGDLTDVPVSVDVIADSRTRYTVVFYVGDAAQRAELKARKPHVKDDDEEAAANATVVEIDDDIDLGSAHGGQYKVRGTLENNLLSGSFEGSTSAAFELKKDESTPPSLGAAPPEGARVLFEGSNLEQWSRWPEKWCLTGDGAMQVCGSNFVTREEFGSAEWHMEFRTPFLPNERGQGRGNSGVYLQGRYEVQVLDSFGLEPADNLCGGIYKVAVPKVNACLPPLQWQTYDITFLAPEFDEGGKVTKNARLTVVQNGITIHEDLELPNPTPGGVSSDPAATGPLLLQDHGNDVRFRNIWVKPLD